MDTGRRQVEDLPPRACRPLTKLKKNNGEKVDPHKVKKQNVDKEGPPTARPPVRPPERGVRGAQFPGKRKKRVYIYIALFVIFSYI